MPKFEFKFKPSYYTTSGAETLARKDIKALRSEYTRMRDVAQKRVQRLQKDWDWTVTGKQSYTLETDEGIVTKMGFPKLSEISMEDLPKAFQELASFVKAGRSTISGQKSAQKKTMDTINKALGAGDEEDEDGEPVEKGEKPLNKKNYQRFIRIMNETRRLKISSIYGSDKILQLADSTLSLSKKDFNKVLDHLGNFLENVGTVQADMETYREKHNGKFNMDKFIKSAGW